MEKVRLKAVYAISSTIRNYEPALKRCLELLPERVKGSQEEVEKLHHEEMEGLDALVGRMREEAKRVR